MQRGCALAAERCRHAVVRPGQAGQQEAAVATGRTAGHRSGIDPDDAGAVCPQLMHSR